MKKINRNDLTASIPFPHDWQRKAIASLYSHAGIRIPLHLLSETIGERRDLPIGDRA